MPAYNFKQRFVPLVKSGAKDTTIRSKRKHLTKIGDSIYLYTGMRTKYCQKIGEGICTDVLDIIITEDGITLGGIKLTPRTANYVAKRDGFIPDRISVTPFELMKRFFSQAYSLPFNGDWIEWKLSH